MKNNWISKAAKIQRKIVYVIYVRNVWISKKIECPKLRELLKKLCTLYVRNVWVCKKSYIQNCVNSTVNCVHYICTERLDLLKNWIFRAAKIRRKIMYVIHVRNVWICRKIEYPKLRKFNGKFFTLYKYGSPGFVEKLNIQNCENSTGNCVHYICTERLDLLKNWISRTAKIQWEIVYIVYVRNGWICQKIEYPELRKFDGKFCTLYMYGMSGFAEKLNIQNCENSKANFVHYICTEGLDLQKNWISRTAKIQWEIVYIIHIRNGWMWRKIEYLELRKFNKKFCMLYIYEMSGLGKKWNCQSCKNSTEICVCYVCTECLD